MVETEGWWGLVCWQPCSKISERPCLKGIRHRVIEKDIQCLLHVWTVVHTPTYMCIHCAQTCTPFTLACFIADLTTHLSWWTFRLLQVLAVVDSSGTNVVHILFFLLWFWARVSYSWAWPWICGVAENDLELLILLSLFCKFWDHRHAPPCLTFTTVCVCSCINIPAVLLRTGDSL